MSGALSPGNRNEASTPSTLAQRLASVSAVSPGRTAQRSCHAKPVGRRWCAQKKWRPIISHHGFTPPRADWDIGRHLICRDMRGSKIHTGKIPFSFCGCDDGVGSSTPSFPTRLQSQVRLCVDDHPARNQTGSGPALSVWGSRYHAFTTTSSCLHFCPPTCSD